MGNRRRSRWVAALVGGALLGASAVTSTAGAVGGSSEWSRVIDGTGTATATGSAVDLNGNTYVTGSFAGSVQFGASPTDTLTARGSSDVYLAKYGPTGTPLWWKRIGTGLPDSPGGVLVSPGGQVILTGNSYGGARFDTPGGELALGDHGGQDVFVARYLPTGTLEWAGGHGGAGTDWVRGQAVDAWGRITIVGSFTQTATFGAGAGAVDITAKALEDGYAASFGPDGSVRWARAVISGGSQDIGYAVAVSSGNLVMAGTFTGTALVGSQQLYAPNLNSGAAVVSRLDPTDGHVVWSDLVRPPGTSYGYAIPSALAAVPGGDVALVGSVAGTVGIGPVPWSAQKTVTSAGSTDVLLARFGPGGAIRWANAAGGTDGDSALAVTARPDGHLLVGGWFRASATFGAGGSAVTLVSGGGQNGFVATYAGDGSLTSAEAASVTVTGLTMGSDAFLRMALNASAPVTFRGATYPTGASGSADGLIISTTP